MAVKHISPDVILFLGDLLDKGSQTVGEEYLSYTKRFDWVFQTGSFNPLVRLLYSFIYSIGFHFASPHR